MSQVSPRPQNDVRVLVSPAEGVLEARPEERVDQLAAAKTQGDATCATSKERQRLIDGEQESPYAFEQGDRILKARPVYKEAEAPNTKGTQTVGTDCIIIGGPEADFKAQLAEIIRKHSQDVGNNAQKLASTSEGERTTEPPQHRDSPARQPDVDDGHHQQPDPGQNRGLPSRDDADTAKPVKSKDSRRVSNKRRRSAKTKEKKLTTYPKGPDSRPYHTRSSKDVNLSELQGLVAEFYKEIGEKAPTDATDDSAASRKAKSDQSPPESTPIDAFMTVSY